MLRSSSPQPNGRRAVVVIGGQALHPGAVARLDPGAFVVAADSGYDHAVAAGIPPSVLLGDLDSISDAGLIDARASGVRVESFPADKDATDTELALDRALAHVGPGGSITMVGGGGDRLDHLLASLTALALPRLAACAELAAWIGPALVVALHAPRTVRLDDVAAGTTVSLVPLGDVGGVTTSGLHWPLTAEPLPGGTSRGVSNVATGGQVAVAAATGVLAVVLPHAADPTPPPVTPQERS